VLSGAIWPKTTEYSAGVGALPLSPVHCSERRPWLSGRGGPSFNHRISGPIPGSACPWAGCAPAVCEWVWMVIYSWWADGTLHGSPLSLVYEWVWIGEWWHVMGKCFEWLERLKKRYTSTLHLPQDRPKSCNFTVGPLFPGVVTATYTKGMLSWKLGLHNYI